MRPRGRGRSDPRGREPDAPTWARPIGSTWTLEHPRAVGRARGVLLALWTAPVGNVSFGPTLARRAVLASRPTSVSRADGSAPRSVARKNQVLVKKIGMRPCWEQRVASSWLCGPRRLAAVSFGPTLARRAVLAARTIRAHALRGRQPDAPTWARQWIQVNARASPGGWQNARRAPGFVDRAVGIAAFGPTLARRAVLAARPTSASRLMRAHTLRGRELGSREEDRNAALGTARGVLLAWWTAPVGIAAFGPTLARHAVLGADDTSARAPGTTTGRAHVGASGSGQRSSMSGRLAERAASSWLCGSRRLASRRSGRPLPGAQPSTRGPQAPVA